MNGQNPNNLENTNNENGMNANVLGNAQSLGNIPNVPNPSGGGNIPIPPAPAVPPMPQTPGTNATAPGNVQGPQPNPIPVPSAPATGTVNAGVTNPQAGVEKPKEPVVVSPNGQVVNPTPIANNPTMQTQPIPGTAPQSSNGPASQAVGMDPVMSVNTNGFVEPNKAENIGAMPPSKDQQKQTKPANKILFILLIVSLIAVVAYGVYYYLSVSKSKVEVTPKEVAISVGDTLSTNPSDYATIKGTNPANCTVNTLNVDVATMGSYEYTIECNNKAYKGTVVVKDGDGPVLGVNILYKKIGSSLVVDEFVRGCEDPSGCSYEFSDATTVMNNMNELGGPYEVAIKAVDEQQNETTENAILYVMPYDVQWFSVCGTEPIVGTNYTKTSLDRFAVGSDGTSFIHLGASRREVKYVFNSEKDYEAAILDKPNTLTFDNNTGFATYDDEKLTVSISNDLNLSTLNTEFNGAFPTDFLALQSAYANKGIVCQNELIKTN